MSASEKDLTAKSLERIALTLAAIYANQLQEADQAAKIRRLRYLGLSNVEIAAALGTTANSIGVAMHRARRQEKPKSGGRSSK